MTGLSTQADVAGQHTDLLIDFSAEASVYFSDFDFISDYLSDNDYLEAIIMVWAEVDGQRVPIDPALGDMGSVVFYHVYQSQ